MTFGAPAAALAVGLLGWVPLLLSIVFAMANHSDAEVAIPLGIAGAAAVLGLCLGAVGLHPARAAGTNAASSVAVGVSGLLGVVALVLALSFHW
jgi:hypothetical protein